MREITIILDYKGHFGSKFFASPYRSGMDINLLKDEFEKFGYTLKIKRFHEINFKEKNYNKIVLYTSSEDKNYFYKSYIEDMIFGLELNGAKTIPEYKYLRANNNKIFMEILRDQNESPLNKIIQSQYFGNLEDLQKEISSFTYPLVIKTSEGAMSKGVFLAEDEKKLIKYAKRISNSKSLLNDIKDYFRAKKHKGYTKESVFRKKFIVQNYVPNLLNDWKVLVYGDRCYILKRTIKPGDFRASGSKYQYKFDINAEFPDGIFDFCIDYKNKLNLPHVSLDVGFTGTDFFVIEFQALYFGTSTLEKSKFFFRKSEKGWISEKNNNSVEEAYAYSVNLFLNK